MLRSGQVWGQTCDFKTWFSIFFFFNSTHMFTSIKRKFFMFLHLDKCVRLIFLINLLENLIRLNQMLCLTPMDVASSWVLTITQMPIQTAQTLPRELESSAITIIASLLIFSLLNKKEWPRGECTVIQWIYMQDRF